MRRGTLLLAAASVLLVMPAPGPATNVLRYYAEAEILIPQADKERLGLYERLCREDLVPQFLGELRKKDPMIDTTIDIARDDVKSTIEIRLGAGDEKVAVAEAEKFAKMAVRTFVAADEAERRGMVEPVRRRASDLEDRIEARTRELTELRTEAGVYGSAKEIEFLVSRLNSYKEQLVQAEMRDAELATELKLLSSKAAEVKDTVSAEEIGALQKTAQELSIQVDEVTTELRQRVFKGAEQNLKLWKNQLQTLRKQHEMGRVSIKEVQDAEMKLNAAEVEYEKLKHELIVPRQLLAKVEQELAEAREKFAETGGLELAATIAQKILDCETEMAGNKTIMEHLRSRIGELEREIAEKQVVTTKLERRQAEVDVLKKSLEALQEEERRLERVMPVRQPQIVRVAWTGAMGMEPRREIHYTVQGEVKHPLSLGGVREEVSLLKAIETAGGFTDIADVENVTVIRRANGSHEKHVIDCKAILEKRAQDPMIVSGDLVWVPRKEGLEAREVVEPEEPRPENLITFEIKGEVKNPGSRTLERRATLLGAIEAAGGFTDEADRQHVAVIRGTDGSTVEHILNCEVLKASDDFVLRPGDVVRVPRRVGAGVKPAETAEGEKPGVFYVQGQVNKPGQYDIGPETTVLRAIAMAGGFTRIAKKKVLVIRATDGSTQRYVVDCDAILKGDAPDVIIRPNDMIHVPESFF